MCTYGALIYHLIFTDQLQNVKFKDLLAVCIQYFGEPRISGSHHIFKMPWFGNPRINLQREGKMAKPYQVKQVIEAIKKMEELKCKTS